MTSEIWAMIFSILGMLVNMTSRCKGAFGSSISCFTQKS